MTCVITSGTVTTRRSFDHELERVFHFVVSVLSTPPALMASSSLPGNTSDVIVRVTDVNDNEPVFEFPSPSNDTVYIGNHQQPG